MDREDHGSLEEEEELMRVNASLMERTREGEALRAEITRLLISDPALRIDVSPGPLQELDKLSLAELKVVRDNLSAQIAAQSRIDSNVVLMAVRAVTSVVEKTFSVPGYADAVSTDPRMMRIASRYGGEYLSALPDLVQLVATLSGHFLVRYSPPTPDNPPQDELQPDQASQQSIGQR